MYDGSHDRDMIGIENCGGCDLKNEKYVCSGEGLKKTMVDRWLSKRMDNMLNKEC